MEHQPEKRAADINWAFTDGEVKAIMCVKGGEDSNTTLDYIDYEMIKKHPKIICGFSDNTSILNAIHEKTGLVTYHGPTFKSLTSWETGYAYKQFIKTFAENTESLIMGEPEDRIHNYTSRTGYRRTRWRKFIFIYKISLWKICSKCTG